MACGEPKFCTALVFRMFQIAHAVCDAVLAARCNRPMLQHFESSVLVARVEGCDSQVLSMSFTMWSSFPRRLSRDLLGAPTRTTSEPSPRSLKRKAHLLDGTKAHEVRQFRGLLLMPLAYSLGEEI